MGKIGTRKRGKTWQYYFQLASVDRTRKWKTGSGYRTKAEALAAGTQALAEYNATGIAFKASEQSVADYFDYWIENYAERELAESTVNTYKKRIRLYIKPHIGSYKLKNIQGETLQKLLADLHKTGMSRNTLGCIKGILTSAFSYATVQAKFIAVDPAYRITLPNKRKDSEVGTRKDEHIFIEKDVWNEIIERFPEGHPSHLPLVLGYYCGLRLGEVYGLTWDCVDFEKKTILINKQMREPSGYGKWLLYIPKYDSARTIIVSDNVLALLKRTRELLLLDQENCGEYYKKIYMNYDEENHILLPTTDLRPVHFVNVKQGGLLAHPRNMQHVSRVIHGKAKKSKVICEDWDFHSLRHTHATLLEQAGVALPLIQKRLGHIDMKMTQRYTNHVTSEMISVLKREINKEHNDNIDNNLE